MRRSRYGYSGYRGRRTAHELLKLIALVLAVLVVLAVGALVLGQDYFVFTDNGLRVDLPFFRKADPGTSELGDVSVVVRPREPDAQEQGEQSTSAPQAEEDALAAVQLPVSAVVDGTAAQRLEAAGANGLVLEMKDREGHLAWRTGQALAVQSSVPMGTEAVNEALRTWNQGEVYTVARVYCFRDNTLPYQRNDVALRASYGNWRDELGLRWLNPDSRDAREYLAGLCGELAQLGFDEIVLVCASFPCRGDLEAISSGGSFAGGGYEDGTASFLGQVRETLAPYGTVLSLETDREALGSERSGLTGTVLESNVERLWLAEDGLEPTPAELLAGLGLSRPEQRLVAVVPALEGTAEGSRAVLEGPAS